MEVSDVTYKHKDFKLSSVLNSEFISESLREMSFIWMSSTYLLGGYSEGSDSIKTEFS